MRYLLAGILIGALLLATPLQAESGLERITERFMALDKDENGAVSFDEFMQMVRKRAEDRFAAMDADGDGEVTEEEFRSFWQKRKAQWYRLQH